VSAFRLVSEGWEEEILKARRAHPSGLRIICPFMKAGAVSRLVAAGARADIEVVTRFDLACIDAGASDLDALRTLLDAGGRVRGVRGLHSKLYLFGGRVAIATSANLTNAALRTNHEFGFVTDEAAVVGSCVDYFGKIWRLAGRDLTVRQLDRWEAILTAHRRKHPGSPTSPLPDFGVTVAAETPFEASGTPPRQSNQAFIKFFGTGINRAERSLSVADLIAENGAHWACTYPASKPPRQVMDGDEIFMGRLVRETDDIMIFGVATGRHHDEGLDMASAAEIRDRPWKADWPRYVRVHGGRFVNATLAEGVSFRDMLASLGSDAFRSTQRNAEHGVGNTDPTLSYLRKAHMLLTDRSRAWIEARLEEALRLHGEVDLASREFGRQVARKATPH
jgi:hypothetical protein